MNIYEYSQLSKDQLDQAYEYYLKEAIRQVHAFQNNPIHVTHKNRVTLTEILYNINNIRKVQGETAISIKQIHMGDTSVYLNFF